MLELITLNENNSRKKSIPPSNIASTCLMEAFAGCKYAAALIRDDSGGSMRAAGVVMDITEQKQSEHEMRALEQQLRQAQKMEALGRLARGIAHDFNNLLMIIQSYTEMLQDSLPVQDGLRSSTEQVLKAAYRGAGLTKQLLAFSHKQVISPVILDLNAEVSEAAKMLKRLIGEDIELRVNSAESLWAVKPTSTRSPKFW